MKYSIGRRLYKERKGNCFYSIKFTSLMGNTSGRGVLGYDNFILGSDKGKVVVFQSETGANIKILAPSLLSEII